MIMATQAAPELQAGESFKSDCRQTVSFGFEHTRKMVPDDQATAHVDNFDGSLMTMMHMP